jgi:hypothetical protein
LWLRQHVYHPDCRATAAARYLVHLTNSNIAPVGKSCQTPGGETRCSALPCAPATS